MRTANHKKTQSLNINSSGVFFKNVVEKSKNFKDIAGKNYSKISKCLPQIGENLESIFSSDAQKTKAMNYVRSYRNKNNPAAIYRKKMLSQYMNPSFIMDNSSNINNSLLAQTMITNRPPNGRMLSQYDLSNLLGDIEEENKKKKEFIYDNIDDELNNNNDIFSDRRSIGFSNNLSSRKNKTLCSSRKNDKTVNFVLDTVKEDKKNELTVNSFSFIVGKPIKKSILKKAYVEEKSNFTLASSVKSKSKSGSFTSVTNESSSPEGFSLLSIKSSNQLPEKIDIGKESELVDDEDFSGFIIMKVSKGKKIKSYKFNEEDDVEKLNEELKKGNVKIKDSYLHFSCEHKREDIEEGINTLEIQKKDNETNTIQKENKREIETNCFEYTKEKKEYETKATNTSNEVKPNVIEQQGFEYKTPTPIKKSKTPQPNQIEKKSFELKAQIKDIKPKPIIPNQIETQSLEYKKESIEYTTQSTNTTLPKNEIQRNNFEVLTSHKEQIDNYTNTDIPIVEPPTENKPLPTIQESNLESLDQEATPIIVSQMKEEPMIYEEVITSDIPDMIQEVSESESLRTKAANRLNLKPKEETQKEDFGPLPEIVSIIGAKIVSTRKKKKPIFQAFSEEYSKAKLIEEKEKEEAQSAKKKANLLRARLKAKKK